MGKTEVLCRIKMSKKPTKRRNVTGEPEAERSEADGSTKQRNMATVKKKISKILNNSENISQHLPTKNSPITGNIPPCAKGTGRASIFPILYTLIRRNIEWGRLKLCVAELLSSPLSKLNKPEH